MRKIAFSDVLRMRIPTFTEVSALMQITKGAYRSVNWKNIYSWVDDPRFDKRPNVKMCCEYSSGLYWTCTLASNRLFTVGFRPAFEIEKSVAASIRDGSTVIVGTLYMGDEPVKVPQQPVTSKDVLGYIAVSMSQQPKASRNIAEYIPGSPLKLQDALNDPAYQITAIKAGNVLIAEKVILKLISYNDIIEALTGSAPLDSPSLTSEQIQFFKFLVSEHRNTLKSSSLWTHSQIDEIEYLDSIDKKLEMLELSTRVHGKEKILYHATFKDYIPSIMEKGLGVGTVRNWADSDLGVTCLATNPEVAASFCKTAEETPMKVYRSGIVILEVNCTGLDLAEDNLANAGGKPGCYKCQTKISKDRILGYQDYR